MMEFMSIVVFVFLIVVIEEVGLEVVILFVGVVLFLGMVFCYFFKGF